MPNVFETKSVERVSQERRIGYGEFGDIWIKKHIRDGTESFCVEKDYRGDEERAKHSYGVWSDLQAAGIPTFAWYERSKDRRDVLLMPYIGSETHENGSHVSGDILCASPLQRSEGMNILEMEGLDIREGDIDDLCANVLAIIRGADEINAELTHDSVLFAATFQEGRWNLTEIFIGDFDAVYVHGEEAGYINPTELHEKNLIAVIGTTRHFVEEFARKALDIGAEEIGEILKECVRLGRILSEEEKKNVMNGSAIPSLSMKTTSWDDL
jgi:hypothetical protein